MNGRNDAMNPEVYVLIALIFFAYVMLAVVAALAIMLTVILTGIAFVAYCRDGLTLCGDYTSREQARAFFVRGFIGAVVFPIFIAIVFALLDMKVPHDYGWVAFAGYALGSVGGEFETAMEEAKKSSQQVILPPLPESQQYLPPSLPPQPAPREPFRFASWDDEESGR